MGEQEFKLTCVLGKRSARRIVLGGEVVRFHLPIFHADDPLVVPVADILGVGRRIDFGEDGTVLRRDHIVLAVPTGVRTERPNLAIVFRSPQRIPPLVFGSGRDTGLSVSRSRSDSGLTIDGLELKARDADAAIGAFADSGVVTTDNVAGALLQSVGVESDPERLEQRADALDKWSRTILVALVTGIVGCALVFGSSFESDDDLRLSILSAGAAIIAIASGVVWWLGRGRRRGAGGQLN